MGQLILPKRFHPDFKNPRIKPIGDVEIDWSHPLAKDIKHFFLLNSTSPRDLISDALGVNSGATLRGNDVDFDGASDFIDFPNDDIWFTGDEPWSMALHLNLDAFPSSFGGVFTPAYQKGGSTNHNIFVSENASYSPITMRILNSSGSLYKAIRFPTATFGTDATGAHTWAVTHNGISSDDANFRVYKDNLSVAPITGAGTATISQTQMGRYNSGNEMDGSLRYIVVWKRELTQEQMRRFINNPYALLKPRQPAIYFIPAAETGQTITVNQVTETNIAQAIAAGIGAVSILVGQVTEADIPQPVTPLNALIIEVGQVVENNTAQSLTALAGNLDIPVNQVTENNTAQVLTVVQGVNLTVNQVIETNIAQAVTVGFGGVSIPVNQVLETNIAQPITVLQGVEIAVGQVTETDLAQSITVQTQISIPVNQVVETDIAQPVVVFSGEQLPESISNVKIFSKTSQVTIRSKTEKITVISKTTNTTIRSLS